MVVAKVPAGHMPMETLRLQVKAEYVRQQATQRVGDLSYCLAAQSGVALRTVYSCAIFHASSLKFEWPTGSNASSHAAVWWPQVRKRDEEILMRRYAVPRQPSIRQD